MEVISRKVGQNQYSRAADSFVLAKAEYTREHPPLLVAWAYNSC
jgi:hypothetical protein